MKRSTWRVSAAALVLLVGGALLMRSMLPRPQPPSTPPIGHNEDVAALANAELRSLDADLAVESLHASVLVLAKDHPAALTIAQAEALADACGRRFALLRQPDYAAYRAEVHALGGSTHGAGSMMEDGDLWSSIAMQFAGAPISLDSTRIEERWRDGRLVRKPVGHIVSNNGASVYGAPTNPEKSRAHVVDVYIPMEVADPRSGKAMRIFYIMSFAWDAARMRWLPWQTSVYDPSNSEAVLPAPWI